jgi:hypothetical protein
MLAMAAIRTAGRMRRARGAGGAGGADRDGADGGALGSTVVGAAVTPAARVVDMAVTDVSAGAVRRCWLSAAAKSEQFGYRSSGFLAIALAITSLRTVNSGRRSPTSGGGADRCWVMTTAGLEC